MLEKRNKVTILEKPEGETWTSDEVKYLVLRGSVEVESHPRKPNRIVAMNEPLKGGTFQNILDGSSFTARKVDYLDRWA